MTSYHGGKQRIGKKLAKVIYDESMDISEEEGFQIKGYCEPFSGMLGVFQHIPELFKEHKPELEYKAGDKNQSVIMMWKAVQQGWKPPSNVSGEEYDRLKNAPDSAMKGYVGHQYSFGGQYFKGYAPKYGKTLDSSDASSRVVKISTKLSDVLFSYGSYEQYSNLRNCVIYCDPPYDSTEQHYRKSFDSKKFHDWCKRMSNNNIVFVSEYTAPREFEQIWSSTSKLTGVSKSQGKHKSKIRTEKLYLVQSHPNNTVDLLHQN
jgi:DNA adenine methylase